MSVAVKAYFGHEVRRVAIPQDTNLDQFKQLIQQLFAISQEMALRLQYVDDEDEWVKVSTEHEWQEAMRLVVGNMSSVLRVKIGKPRRDAKAVLSDLSSQCKSQWNEKVAPHLETVGRHLPDVGKHVEDWGKRLEEMKNDPRTKQLQQNVEQFATDLTQFLRKQERELPQTVQNYVNQFLSFLSISTDCKQPQPELIAPLIPQQEEKSPEPPVPPPQPVSQDLGSSLADFVVIQNELAESSQHIAIPFDPIVQEEEKLNEPIPQSLPIVPLPQKEEEKQVSAAPSPFEYQIQADLLFAMGFPNKTLNEQLLRKFSGDVARTVDALFE